MDVSNLDLGDMKSRDIGNMISKTLVDIGKDVVDNSKNKDHDYDYGDLPSRALPELGKEAFANYVKHQNQE